MRMVDASNTRLDRSQFMRDAEAGRRLSSEWAATQFLKILCYRRAWLEVQGMNLTKDEALTMISEVELELYRMCKLMGYDQLEWTDFPAIVVHNLSDGK